MPYLQHLHNGTVENNNLEHSQVLDEDTKDPLCHNQVNNEVQQMAESGDQNVNFFVTPPPPPPEQPRNF